VHHGIPADLHKPVFNPRGGYVAFLGRIAPEKRPDRAIYIARTLGIPLKIAAKVDRVDETFFREVVAPLLDQPGVEFIGEISEQQKSDFLGEALALLFTVDWLARAGRAPPMTGYAELAPDYPSAVIRARLKKACLTKGSSAAPIK
jgi:glycosyltransferase involved in cell wall biosynthesis